MTGFLTPKGYLSFRGAFDRVAQHLHGGRWTMLERPDGRLLIEDEGSGYRRWQDEALNWTDGQRADWIRMCADVVAWLAERLWDGQLPAVLLCGGLHPIAAPWRWLDQSTVESVLRTGEATILDAHDDEVTGRVLIAERDLDALFVSSASPPQSAAACNGYSDRWLRIDVFTVDQAAALWAGREPSPKIDLSTNERTAKVLIESGLIAGQLEPLAPPFLPFKTGFVPGSTGLSREALRRFAEAKGERPRFLFPDLPTPHSGEEVRAAKGGMEALSVNAPRQQAQTSTVGAESRCEKWIREQAIAGRTPRNRADMYAEARKAIGPSLSKRGFDRAWHRAAPLEWKAPGQKPRRDS